jgi:uncharacterized repeat protein (TIGR03803 family)
VSRRITSYLMLPVCIFTAGLGVSDWAQAAPTESVLYSFGGTLDGGDPEGALTQDAAGALYGTTQVGGSAGHGIVFQLVPPASGKGAWKETILHDFTDGNDGGNPFSTLVFDSEGALYGTTASGGQNGAGVVFKLTPPKDGKGAWKETILHAFGASESDGFYPFGNLVFDKSGNLYGAADAGGPYGGGAVFELNPPKSANGKWTYALAYSFGAAGDGSYPFSGVYYDSTSGDLFGTTAAGGKYSSGTVFRLSPKKSSWNEAILYNFTGVNDGATPSGQVVLDSSGAFYGTTLIGGTAGAGTVYQLSPNTKLPWKYHLLHAFTGGVDGQFPVGGLAIGVSGNLYGTTYGGGKPPVSPDTCLLLGDPLAFFMPLSPTNCGTVFELSKSGTSFKFQSLHSFLGSSLTTGGKGDGAAPDGAVIVGTSGPTLYGTTTSGGPHLTGTVFAINP